MIKFFALAAVLSTVPGQASANDFVKFHADPRTLFVRDMKTKK